MTVRKMILLDTDEHYIARLAGYLQRRKNFGLEVYPFTDPDRMREYLDGHTVQVVAAGEEMASAVEDILKKRTAGENARLSFGEAPVCLIMTQGERKTFGSFETVQKYQPADALAREILSKLSEHDQAETLPAKLIGVYSPVGRCGKTSLAITLAMQLAQQHRVLYLNLEDYSGFRQMNTPEQSMQDLSDLLYLLRTSPGSIAMRLGMIVQSWEALDYIMPPAASDDLQNIPAQEWSQLFHLLAVDGGYEMIVLDLGTKPDALRALLMMCDRVFVPCLEDPVSRAKLQQFRENAASANMAQAAEKLRFINVPGRKMSAAGGTFPGAWLSTGMNSYVKRLLQAEPL